ncbi:MAG TPA: Hsp70 family protein, partial [Myxococcaceae bacterium]|nr:Hsp70 family protein [Myxococcaceae bacterium]
GLSKSEVEKMVADARAHEGEDKARRELVELRNRAEQMAYQMDKLIKENKEKISADAAKQVEDAVAELNQVREGQDKAAIEDALRKLEQASHRAAEEMYRAAGAGAGGPQPPNAGGPEAGAGPQPGGKKDDVVDAEFRTS